MWGRERGSEIETQAGARKQPLRPAITAVQVWALLFLSQIEHRSMPLGYPTPLACWEAQSFSGSFPAGTESKVLQPRWVQTGGDGQTRLHSFLPRNESLERRKGIGKLISSKVW